MIFPLLGKPTVRVHMTTTEASIEGVLIHKGARELRLLNARMWTAPDASHELDGITVIPREHVICYQTLAPRPW